MLKILGCVILLALVVAFVLPGAGYIAAGIAALCIVGLVLWVLARPTGRSPYQD